MSLCCMDVDGAAQQAGVDWAPDLIVSGEALCKQQEARAQVIQQETLFIYVEALVRLELHTHTTNVMCASKPLHPIHIKPSDSHLQKVSTSIEKYAYQQRHACKRHLKRKQACIIAINRHQRDQYNKRSLRKKEVFTLKYIYILS